MEDINHQYIAYEPKDQTRDGTYRDIKVDLPPQGAQAPVPAGLLRA